MRDCVEERKLAKYDSEIDTHVHLPGNKAPSYGMLKYDFMGTRGLFHSSKSYLIEDEREQNKSVKRFKGCSRDAQSFLSPSFFDVSADTGLARKTGYANQRKLRATAGYQMAIRTESRMLSHPISVKRIYDVRHSVLSFSR